MVRFRPHTLTYSTVSGGGNDANGDFAGGTVSESGRIACRYEPNGKAASISLPSGDGETYVYSYVVYLNADCRDFTYGEMVTLYDRDGKQKASMPCKGFHRGQLDAKLWL